MFGYRHDCREKYTISMMVWYVERGRNWMIIKEYFIKFKALLAQYFFKLVGIIYRILLKENMYIVVIDGGIGSQIDQYCAGNYLESLGYNVKYNINWFKNGGKDALGEQERNYDLTKLFPYLNVPIATDREIRKYCRCYLYYNHWDNFIKNADELPKPPRYLAGYGYEMSDNKRMRYQKLFNINLNDVVLDDKNREMLEYITKEYEAVAMHVRRGDLALGGIDREAVTKDYFVKAANYFKDKGKIFVFSDGMDWVKEELLDILPDRLQLVEINQSDKGWCDLILMSSCKYQIESQSGMAFHAFLLNQHNGKKICVPDMVFSHRQVEFNQIRDDEVHYI